MSLRFRFILSAMLLVCAGTLPIGWYAFAAIDRSMEVWHDAIVREALRQSLITVEDSLVKEQMRAALIRYQQVGALQRPLERRTLAIGGTLTVFILLLAVFVSWVMAVQLTRPLRRVVRAADAIAHGDLTQSVPPSHISEISTLVTAFNDMVVGLRESQEALARAERRAAWQDIARAIAHEIKNPLTPMRLTTQRLREQFTGNRPRFEESLMRSTEMILTEIDRLERLANGFSNFAKMPVPALSWVDARDVVGSLGELFAGECERGRLRVKVSDDLVPIMADHQQLEQSVLNLVKNALEATEETNGSVLVTVGKQAGEALIVVEDDGPGVPSEIISTLFQPYVTTKPEGSGIGLAVVERVITDHDGRVEVVNVKPHGARFTVRLPLGRAENGAHDAVRRDAGGSDRP